VEARGWHLVIEVQEYDNTDPRRGDEHHAGSVRDVRAVVFQDYRHLVLRDGRPPSFSSPAFQSG
jgi:hypothetical protein